MTDCIDCRNVLSNSEIVFCDECFVKELNKQPEEARVFFFSFFGNGIHSHSMLLVIDGCLHQKGKVRWKMMAEKLSGTCAWVLMLTALVCLVGYDYISVYVPPKIIAYWFFLSIIASVICIGYRTSKYGLEK